MIAPSISIGKKEARSTRQCIRAIFSDNPRTNGDHLDAEDTLGGLRPQPIRRSNDEFRRRLGASARSPRCVRRGRRSFTVAVAQS